MTKILLKAAAYAALFTVCFWGLNWLLGGSFVAYVILHPANTAWPLTTVMWAIVFVPMFVVVSSRMFERAR